MTTKSMTNNHMNHGVERHKGHTIIGVALAIIGFFWLAKKVGWIPVAAGGSAVFWPAVTIAMGIAIIVSARRRHTNRATGDPPVADLNNSN
jgi:hypothetical protein